VGRGIERGLGRAKYRKKFLGCICGSDDGGRRPLDNFGVMYKTNFLSLSTREENSSDNLNGVIPETYNTP